VIDQICGNESVELICAVFSCPGPVYAHLKRAQRIDAERMALRNRLHDLFVDSRSPAGSCSIMSMMREEGTPIGHFKDQWPRGRTGIDLQAAGSPFL
jgi:putative transposase